MPEAPEYRSLWHRIHDKAASFLPLAVVSGLLLGVLWLLGWLLFPLFPVEVQAFLTRLEDGDWETAREGIRDYLESFGVGLVPAFLAAEVLQVLISPLPGQFLGLAAGYLFGFWAGLLLALAGEGLGAAMAMVIGRLLGRHVVRRLVPQWVQEKFDAWMARGGVWSFFLLTLLPAFPDDAICYLAGVTRLPLGKLLLACVVGRVPYLALLTFIGASAGWGTGVAYAALASGIVVAVVLWLFSEEVEAWLRARLPRRGRRPVAQSAPAASRP